MDEPVERPRLYPSVEVVRAAGITYRQLDYWCRIDVLKPVMPAYGSGTQRRFDELGVLTAAVIGVVGADAHGPVVDGVREALETGAPMLAVAAAGTRYQRRLRAEPVRSLEELRRLGQGQAVVLVDVDTIRVQIEARLADACYTQEIDASVAVPA